VAADKAAKDTAAALAIADNEKAMTKLAEIELEQEKMEKTQRKAVIYNRPGAVANTVTAASQKGSNQTDAMDTDEGLSHLMEMDDEDKKDEDNDQRDLEDNDNSDTEKGSIKKVILTNFLSIVSSDIAYPEASEQEKGAIEESCCKEERCSSQKGRWEKTVHRDVMSYLSDSSPFSLMTEVPLLHH
jgi:hypothetical protein